jgi:hypothetical protein
VNAATEHSVGGVRASPFSRPSRTTPMPELYALTFPAARGAACPALSRMQDLLACCWLSAVDTPQTHGDALLAVGGADNTVSIISMASAAVVSLLKGHTQARADTHARAGAVDCVHTHAADARPAARAGCHRPGCERRQARTLTVCTPLLLHVWRADAHAAARTPDQAQPGGVRVEGRLGARGTRQEQTRVACTLFPRYRADKPVAAPLRRFACGTCRRRRAWRCWHRPPPRPPRSACVWRRCGCCVCACSASTVVQRLTCDALALSARAG